MLQLFIARFGFVSLLMLSFAERLHAQCIDPDLSAIASEAEITLCNGSTVKGQMTVIKRAKCSKSGETNCVTTTAVPAGDTTKIAAQDVKLGTSVGGVSGQMRFTKICKNGLGKHSLSATMPWPGTGASLGGTVAINNGSTTVTLTGANFGWYIGPYDSIIVAGQTRTVATVTSSTVLDVTVPFTTTTAGAAWGLIPYSADGSYLLSDEQSGGTYTGAGRTNCNETNFTDVTSTSAPYQPSGDAGWTNIYRDDLTGVFFTNKIHAGLTLAEAAAKCEALNGFATGGTGWRLPTQKEVLQLGIDGASFILGSGAFWHSTTYTTAATPTMMSLPIGHFNSSPGITRGTNVPVVCLREN